MYPFVRLNGSSAESDAAGRSPSVIARFTGEGSVIKQEEELWMTELKHLGCSVNLAWPSCLLITPLGCVAIPPPQRH